jgi:hypothetical protein
VTKVVELERSAVAGLAVGDRVAVEEHLDRADIPREGPTGEQQHSLAVSHGRIIAVQPTHASGNAGGPSTASPATKPRANAQGHPTRSADCARFKRHGQRPMPRPPTRSLSPRSSQPAARTAADVSGDLPARDDLEGYSPEAAARSHAIVPCGEDEMCSLSSSLHHRRKALTGLKEAKAPRFRKRPPPGVDQRSVQPEPDDVALTIGDPPVRQSGSYRG